MSTTLTLPQSNVPIGYVIVGGVRYDVPQSSEFQRLLFDLYRRVGKTVAPTNTDLDSLISEIDSVSLNPQSDLTAQEAIRAVDELRNELSSLRSDCDALRSQLAERDAELAGMRSVTDLRSRVEQLEDRLV